MNRIRNAILMALSVAVPAPALALSCLAPDAARTFNQLDEAEERYVVVHGVLTFDDTKLPETDLQDQTSTPDSTPLPARLIGKSLSRDGFQTPYDKPITLDVRCFGPWCAGAPSGVEILGFVELRESGPVLTLDPCSSTSFIDPDETTLNQVTDCMRGDACKPMR